MHSIVRIYTKMKDGNSGELQISYGYRNTKGEIYLAENEICRKIEKTVQCQELSSEYSEIDANEDIYLEVIKIKNNKFKKIHLYIKGSLCKTIGLNKIGEIFEVDIDDGYEVNKETWTILSIEEIREKIDLNQEYFEDI